MKYFALLALLPCMAFAGQCPDQSKAAASKRKPCVSWSPVTLRENGRPLPPSELAGYVVHWERTANGKKLSGKTEIVKDTEYFFPNANRNYSYRFWAVTHDTAGQTSESSQIGTWGKQ